MEMTNDRGKPVLGCAPAYIRSGERIRELADAIGRASAEANNYPGHITMWAQEIIMQCEIMKKCGENEAEQRRD